MQRTTQVFAAPPTLAQTWPEAESLVVVERKRKETGRIPPLSEFN
ncbi:MAG TPA: hypothetical protein V6C95_01585 [Coleofasciculaceae cyanobacterium]